MPKAKLATGTLGGWLPLDRDRRGMLGGARVHGGDAELCVEQFETVRAKEGAVVDAGSLADAAPCKCGANASEEGRYGLSQA